jgi:hypothetical protein
MQNWLECFEWLMMVFSFRSPRTRRGLVQKLLRCDFSKVENFSHLAKVGMLYLHKTWTETWRIDKIEGKLSNTVRGILETIFLIKKREYLHRKYLLSIHPSERWIDTNKFQLFFSYPIRSEVFFLLVCLLLSFQRCLFG